MNPPGHAPATSSTPRILVADADTTVRDRLHHAFAAAGYDVVDAADGHQALLQTLLRRPTLVITELHLPILDGFALCEVLRRDQTTSHIPILVVTKETAQAELVRARRVGANAVLTKAAVEAVLSESRRLLAYAHELVERSEVVRSRLLNQLAKSTALRARSEQQRRAALEKLPSIAGARVRPGNRLLAALPADDRDRLAPRLKSMPIRQKQILHKAGETIREVYFPSGGVVSVVTVLSAGTMVEVASIGHEGMVGLEACLDDYPIAMAETVSRVPDTDAIVMSVADLRDELRQPAAFRYLLARYAQAFAGQMIQSAACNALHPVRQRCARWLLTTDDRVRRREFQLSHEFLAAMLGVSRPTVSEVAAAFQRDGLISYTHGQMRVVQRKSLEAEACECYAILRHQFDRMFAV